MNAVITADIVSSTKFLRDDFEYAVSELNDLFKKIKKNEFGLIGGIEWYRGDSFQTAFSKPEHSLKLCIMIKCSLKASVYYKEERRGWNQSVISWGGRMIDARLAVGIGGTESLSKRLATSDGEAFHISGRLLDKMHASGNTLMIQTTDPKLNQELEIYCLLLDAVMERWSPYQASYVLEKLKFPEITDTELAMNFKVSQSALSQRRNTSNWYVVEKLISRFENIIKSKV